MDIVVAIGNDESFSQPFEKIERKSLKTTFLDSIGAHEIFSSEMWRAALAETVATTFFLFTLTTCLLSCYESNVTDPKLLVPFAVFIVAFFFLFTMFPLTGAFLNPLLTFIATLKGAICLVRACVIFLGQCLASIMAIYLLKCAMSHDAVEKYMLGGCTINDNGSGISLGTALMLEFVCTFIILLVAVTVGFDKKRSKELGATMVCIQIAASLALAIYVSSVVTGKIGYAGAGLNPARCFASALLFGGPLWHGQWVFWLGPFLACIVYHIFSKTLPKEGLVNDGKYEIIKVARACIRATGSNKYKSATVKAEEKPPCIPETVDKDVLALYPF